MQSSSVVDIADRRSRKRAWIGLAAALVFLLSAGLRAAFGDTVPASYEGIDWWAFNAILVLLLLATGGGILLNRKVRDLMNDEISRGHLTRGLVAGYWVAMITAMGIYLVPQFREIPSRLAIYIVVSASAGLALLWASYLEIRAHRDV